MEELDAEVPKLCLLNDLDGLRVEVPVAAHLLYLIKI